MTRNLDGVPTSVFDGSELVFSDFVKIEFPTSGTKRYTDHPGGFTGDIDGSSQTWAEEALTIGRLQQSRDDVLEVSWVQFSNIEFTWTSFASELRGTKVTVWRAWFDPSTGSLHGSPQMFAGRIDDATIGTHARLTLIPHTTPWSHDVPPQSVGPDCFNVFKDPATCQYVGVDTSCLKTFNDCDTRTGGSNTVNFNGFRKLPNPDEKVYWSQVVRN